MNFKKYSSEDFVKLKKAGQITASALDFLTDKVKPGVATNYLDKIASEFLLDKNCEAILSK